MWVTSSRKVVTDLPLTWRRSWKPQEEVDSERSWVLVLSCPWDSRLTAVLSVSQSLWTDGTDGSISAMLKISETGWAHQLTIFEKLSGLPEDLAPPPFAETVAEAIELA